MKAVIQRVTSASVVVEGETIGTCGHGLLILLGVATGDNEEDLERILQRIVKLRIFEDENGKMNRSVQDIDGEMLVVSQFTLLANYKHGNRPDYLGAAAPAEANRLYELFIEKAKAYVRHVGHGKFGADMKVSLLNDGPVTIVMESDVLKPAAKA
jgi:D-tyrosyl-tRNA(Tyr) deacylase